MPDQNQTPDARVVPPAVLDATVDALWPRWRIDAPNGLPDAWRDRAADVARAVLAAAASSSLPDSGERGWSGETCGQCGRPVAESCPSYWLAADELWNEVEGGPAGIRCIPCFTADCEKKAGIHVAWRAVRVDEMDALVAAERGAASSSSDGGEREALGTALRDVLLDTGLLTSDGADLGEGHVLDQIVEQVERRVADVTETALRGQRLDLWGAFGELFRSGPSGWHHENDICGVLSGRIGSAPASSGPPAGGEADERTMRELPAHELEARRRERIAQIAHVAEEVLAALVGDDVDPPPVSSVEEGRDGLAQLRALADLCIADGEAVERRHLQYIGEMEDAITSRANVARRAIAAHDADLAREGRDAPAREPVAFETSERGFKHYAPIPTTAGQVVKVYESSSAMEPCLWLAVDDVPPRVTDDGEVLITAAHLAPDHIDALIATLVAARDNHYHRVDVPACEDGGDEG